MRKATAIYKNFLQTTFGQTFNQTWIKEVEEGLLSTMETCLVPRNLFSKIEDQTNNVITELYSQFQNNSQNIPPLKYETQTEWDYSRLSEWIFPTIETKEEEEETYKDKKKRKVPTPQKIQKQKKKDLTTCAKALLNRMDENLLKEIGKASH